MNYTLVRLVQTEKARDPAKSPVLVTLYVGLEATARRSSLYLLTMDLLSLRTGLCLPQDSNNKEATPIFHCLEGLG